MNKAEKVNYINTILDRFENARNHGNNGNNWWYPMPFRIAYNVKMYSFLDIDKLREMMSDRQRKYYDRKDLNDLWYETINQEAELAIGEIKEISPLIYDVFFAGRSGGWCEVQYNKEIEEVDVSMPLAEINEEYRKAKELDIVESVVEVLIESSKKSLCKYIDSEQYYKDLLSEVLLQDNDIAETYKGQIHKLTEELK